MNLITESFVGINDTRSVHAPENKLIHPKIVNKMLIYYPLKFPMSLLIIDKTKNTRSAPATSARAMSTKIFILLLYHLSSCVSSDFLFYPSVGSVSTIPNFCDTLLLEHSHTFSA